MKNKLIQKNIPSGWKQVTLGDLFDFKNGLNSEKENFGHGVRFINIMEILKHDFLVAEDIPGRINVDPKRNKENVVEYGDVLFNRTSETPDEVGMTSVYLDTEPVVFGGFVIRAKPKSKELNDLFKKYCFSSEQFRKEVIKQGQGVVRGNIGQSNLRAIPFLLPPKEEQTRIVSVLETVNQIIQKLESKIKAKEQIKKGLMRDLLTGKKRLNGFKDKWETVELGDVSEFINGYTFKSSDYRDSGKYKIITIANVQDGLMVIDNPKSINELPSNISSDQILKKGDILISMTGNVGRVCIVDTDNCLLNQRVGKIKPLHINKDLLYLFLHDPKFLSQMIGGAQGGAQANLSTGDIKGYSFDTPKSKEEQNAIAEILTTADKEITELEKKLSILKEQKRYLLNNLITGKIRTPETLSTKITK